MLPFLLGIHMKFEDYYKDFCDTLGHPLFMLPVMMIGMFLFIEVIHTNEHHNMNGDAHGYCGRKEWVQELERFYENNAY